MAAKKAGGARHASEDVQQCQHECPRAVLTQLCTMGARKQSPKGLDGRSYQGGVLVKGLPFTPAPRALRVMQALIHWVEASCIRGEVRRPWQPVWALYGSQVAR